MENQNAMMSQVDFVSMLALLLLWLPMLEKQFMGNTDKV